MAYGLMSPRAAVQYGKMQTSQASGLRGRRTDDATAANCAALASTEEPGAAALLPTRAETLDPQSDAALVARAAQGDVRAFSVLVERYQRPMAALVGRIATQPDDVDDIVQELFVRAWKGLPRFRGDAQFSTWLYRIAVNTAIKHRARHKNDAALSLSEDRITGGLDALHAPGDAPAMQGGDPFRAAHQKEREEAVRQAVSSLPEKQRAVVVLHYFEGHSCEEISRMVGCSLGTVWSRLHYACKRLKGVLEQTEGVL